VVVMATSLRCRVSAKINSVIPIFDKAMETITDICNLRLNS